MAEIHLLDQYPKSTRPIEERARLVTAADDWTRLFADVGYTGDYYWFIPQ